MEAIICSSTVVVKVQKTNQKKVELSIKEMIIMLTTDVRRVGKAIRARFDLWFESASRTLLAEGDGPRGYHKVSGAFFQSVTTRTAGFASFNQKAMLESSAKIGRAHV